MAKLSELVSNTKTASVSSVSTKPKKLSELVTDPPKNVARLGQGGAIGALKTVNASANKTAEKKTIAPTPLMSALSTGKAINNALPTANERMKSGAMVPAQATTTPKTVLQKNYQPINTNGVLEAKPNTFDRVVSTVKGGIQSSVGSNMNVVNLATKGIESWGGEKSASEQAKESQIAYIKNKLADPDISSIKKFILERRLDTAEKQITAADLDKATKKVIQSGAENTNSAKEGLGKTGRVAVDVGSNIVQLVADVLTAKVGGVSALVPMASRSFGGGAYEAEQDGGSLKGQALYGAASAATEMLTEKMLNIVSPFSKAFGKGAADDIVKNIINRLAKTEAGRAVLQYAASSAGEGIEEMVSDAVNPALRSLYNNKSVGENYTKFDVENMLYDGLVGATVGAIAGAPATINNINSGKAKSQDVASNNLTPTQNATEAPTIAPNLQRVVSPVSTENATQGNTKANTVKNSGDAETHIDNRTMNSVKARKTNSFQYDHPELHQYFEYSADLLSMEVENQMANDFMRPAAKKGSATEARVGGRYKAKGAVKTLMDAGLTKPQILQSLQDIKNDHGSENYAAAKRVELVLDDMMTNGYAAYTGDVVPAIDEYVKAKQAIEGAKTNEQRQAEYDETVDFIEGTPSTSLFPENSLGAKITTPKSNIPLKDSKNTASVQNAQSNELGAANSGFDPYSRLSNKYGAIPEGEKPVRVVDVPAQTSDTNKVSRGVRTALEAQATPESAFAQSAIQDAVADDKFSYIPITDKSSVEKANKTISDKGWDVAVKDWTAEARKGVVLKDLIVQGQVLYNNAMNAGDVKGGVDILVDLVKMSRSGAQATQANRVLKTLSPEYQLYALQRSVQSMSDELTTKFEKKGFKGIVLDETLVKEYMDAKTDTERDAVMEKLKDNVASQVPSTWYDKWNAWRYLAMLGNPRTHIRNIVGNAGFVPVRGVKNVLSAGIEHLFKVDTKTKALLTLKDSPLIEQAQKFYAQDEEAIMSLGKFDNWAGDINERRTIFKTKPAEALRKGNTNLLNKEDTWFAKPAYTNALAGYLKANKITADALSNGKVEQSTMDRAREYAVREAQRATYRDSNKFSDFVAGLGKTKSGAANVLVEGVLPFKRTPANILARAVEYSPAGLIKGLTYDLYQVKNGNMEAWQAIDNISAGLTGLGIVGLGAWLASMGLISGGKDKDDKTAGLNTLTGYQNYALNVGGKSYTLDWLAPEALPFFVGVEFFNTLTDKSEKGITFADAITKVSNIAEPMLEMSMLQGVNDLIDSVKYSDNSNILGIAATSAVNYLSQGLPTIFGQVERITEPNRQTTYINSTSGIPTSIQYMLGKTANKIPFVDFQQRDYTDAFGNKQSSGSVFERALNNLINPAYVSTTKDNAVTNELKRLNEGKYLTRIPEQAARTFDYGGATYNLTKTEYDQYSKTLGQTTYKLMQTMIDKSEYKNMTDTEKADVMAKIIGYSNDEAKRELVTAKGKTYTSNNYQKAYEASKQGINVADYFLFKNALDKVDANGSATQLEISQALEQTNLSTGQKGALWQLQNDGASEKNPYTGTLAQKGLSPQKTIEIMSAYDNIKNSVDDNYVKTENSPGAAQVKAAYLNQWLTRQGYTSAQITAITDVFTTWQMIPIEKPSKKATAFVAANPMP